MKPGHFKAVGLQSSLIFLSRGKPEQACLGTAA